MEEKRRELNPEEMEQVGGGNDAPNPYNTPTGECGTNKHYFICKCGFKTTSKDECLSHIAQNPNHAFMRCKR